MIIKISTNNLDDSKNEIRDFKYCITTNGDITSNQNYFNVPIKIQGQNFSPTDSYKLIINNLNDSATIETLEIQFINTNYLSTILVVPSSEQDKELNLTLSLFANNKLLADNISFKIQMPQNSTNNNHLSIPAIIGITVTIIVVVGLIGWIIYLVIKRKKN